MIRVDDPEPDMPVLPPLKDLGAGIRLVLPEMWLADPPVTTTTATATASQPHAAETQQVQLQLQERAEEGKEVRPLRIQKCRARKLPPLPVRSRLREKSSMAASFLRASTVRESIATARGREKVAMGNGVKDGAMMGAESATELETRELCKVLGGDDFKVRLFDGRGGLGIAIGAVRIGEEGASLLV